MGRQTLRMVVGTLVCSALVASLTIAPVAASAAGTSTIAYTYQREECPVDRGGWFDILTVQSDGASSAELTHDGRESHVTWSPDGTRIACIGTYYHPDMWPARNIVTMRADGSDHHVLATWPRDITDIAWSPDMRYMAIADYDAEAKAGAIRYYNVRTGQSWRMLAVGRGVRVVDMAWSPDGTRLAFCQRTGSTYRSRILTVTSGKVVDASVRDARNVAWSKATGTQAFTVRLSDGGYRIRLVKPGGTVSTLVWPIVAGGTSWSPDGATLAFDGTWTLQNGIFAIGSDGSGLRLVKSDFRIMPPRYTALEPAWRPVVTRSAARFLVTFPKTSDYLGPEPIEYTLVDEGGDPLADRTVTMQSSSDGLSWRAMAIRATDSRGRVTTWARPAKIRYYRAFYPGDDSVGQVTSVIGSIKPRVDISTPKVPSSARRGAYFTVSGSLRPYHKAGSTRTSPVRLYFYRYETSGGTSKWVLRRIATAACKRSSIGMSYRTSVSLPYRGYWSVRAYHPEDSLHAPTHSAERRLTVR